MDLLFKIKQSLTDYSEDLEVHSRRVSILAYEAAKILKMRAHLVSVAGYMHDLGKTTWPAVMLDKYPLLPEDWGYVKAHPLVGEDIALKIWPEIPDLIRRLIRSHHERPDGTGYPDGLTSLDDETLLLAACDSFDAMTSARIYRLQGALPIDYALREIERFAPARIVSALALAVSEIAV